MAGRLLATFAGGLKRRRSTGAVYAAAPVTRSGESGGEEPADISGSALASMGVLASAVHPRATGAHPQHPRPPRRRSIFSRDVSEGQLEALARPAIYFRTPAMFSLGFLLYLLSLAHHFLREKLLLVWLFHVEKM